MSNPGHSAASSVICGRRLSRVLCTALAAGVVAAAGIGGVAAATTGPGYLISPPKYRISLKLLKAYTGRYATTSTSPKSRITSSELYLGVAESGYAAGGISIYSYNAAGTLQSFASTIYNVHLVGGGQIEADIVGAGGRPVLGHLFFRHAHGTRNLVGQIDPPSGGGPFAIAYRYAASAGPLPGQANTPVPGPPNAGTVTGSGLTSASKPTTPAPKGVPGWGPTGRFLGRYHLIPGAVAAPASRPAGIFTVALATADQLAASSQRPTGGQLTLFMRTVKKTLPPVPSGILSLETPAGSTVVYLTQLSSAGLGRKALVNGGSFLGPTLGSLTGTSSAAGSLTATITTQALGTFSARFSRFSASPKP